MNKYQVQKKLRMALDDMTDEQLSKAEQDAVKLKHLVTAQTFCELAAEDLARDVKRNPNPDVDVVRVMRVSRRYPGLAQELLKYFPNEEWLKEIAEGRDEPLTRRDPDGYAEEFYLDQEWATKRLDAAKATGGIYSVDWLIAYAERFAAHVPFTKRGGDWDRWEDWDGLNPTERHLREERIDALASLLSLFVNPDRAVACPVE